MFKNLKKPRNITDYTLLQGVTDFSEMYQFNLYETGYSFLVVAKIPYFLEKLAQINSEYNYLVNSFVHILEYEFRGLDGLEDLTVDTLEITNGINSVNVIGKVNDGSSATVSMRFFEKSGATITKFMELYLTGIKDPKTQIKHYHGLLESGDIEEAGYEHEIFTLLYMVTDNTAREIERAYLLLAAQPTKAELSIYNSEKGDIGNKEITVEFNCYPVRGEAVYEKAAAYLAWMHNDDNPNKIIVDSDGYNYKGLDQVKISKTNGLG